MVLSLRLLLQASVACGVCLAAADVPENAMARPGENNSAANVHIPSFQLSRKQLAETAKASALANALPHAGAQNFPESVPSSILGGTLAAKENACAIPLTEVKAPRGIEFTTPKPKAPAKGAQSPQVMRDFDRIGIKPVAPSCSELRATAKSDETERQR